MAQTTAGQNYISDSNWDIRSTPISLRRLMYLESHPNKPDTFLSTSAAYPPTPSPRTYGGHVFAQSAWAAAHTVPYGLHVHSITGYFLLLGDTRYAFEYRVKRVRDGGVYALRQVEAYQNSKAAEYGKAPVFVCFVGFKRDEKKKHKAGAKGHRQDFEHQECPKDWLRKEYGNVIGNKSFEDWPVSQGMDGMWPEGSMSIEMWKRRGDAYPGLEMRKVDMQHYARGAVKGALADGGEVARRWRLLQLYKIVVDEQEESEVIAQKRKKTGADDVLNLHACGHLYSSDRNSLFLAQRALAFERCSGHIGSLSHTVNFHGHASALRMVDSQGHRKVFAQEAWVSNSGADRVCHNSRLWDMESGQIIASTVQDGMMRIPVEQSYAVIDGDALLRREAKL